MLGRKSGRGFYLYPKDAKKGAKRDVNPEVGRDALPRRHPCSDPTLSSLLLRLFACPPACLSVCC